MNDISCDIVKKAVCVDLFTKHWSGRKFDPKVSEDTARRYGAKTGAGRYNKLLVPKHALQKIENIIGCAYRVHYAYTMPWGEGKIRITTAKCYFTEYVPRMSVIKDEFNRAVEDFIKDYPAYVADEARDMLQGMFNPNDYPTIGEMKEKFDLIVAAMPVPTGNDFRLDIHNEQLALIQESWKEEVERRSSLAFEHLFERLIEPLQKLAEIDSKDRKQLRKSITKNIIKTCDDVDLLNIWGDQRIEDMTTEISSAVSRIDMEYIRDNPLKRAETAKIAQDIIDRIKIEMCNDPQPSVQVAMQEADELEAINNKMSFMK